MSLTSKELVRYTARQLDYFFPDEVAVGNFEGHVNEALRRLLICFSANENKYFRREGEVWFDHLHSDQYATFLYFLSNSIFRAKGDARLSTKLYYLNKILHGLNVYYEVELPDIFFLSHPVGTVLGRAKYSDYLLVHQGCTIGNNHGLYPTIGRYCCVYAGASILGNSTVGENCKIATNSILLDQHLASDKIFIGLPSGYTLKDNRTISHVWGGKSC